MLLRLKSYCLITSLFYFATAVAHATSEPFLYETGSSINANPAAVNVTIGTGTAQKYFEKELNIKHIDGLDIQGAWIADTNNLFSGGIPDPERWTSNSALLLAFSADTEKLYGWQEGLFYTQFLQFNGEASNTQAGTVQGYNSLPGPNPLSRTELYQFWYKQAFFDRKFIVRLGKSVPNYDFNDVLKPDSLSNEKLIIPSVSGLLYTPIFVNPTILGVLPGYYNSAYGATLNFTPIKKWYLSYGVYDGNLAQGKQTGIKIGPTFNGSYFHIGETGCAWLLGKNNMPGNAGIGAWHQAGLIQGTPTLTENSASGMYLFGSQRLWYKNPGVDNAGISAFYQYGINNSTALSVNQFAGAGFTAFGLVPHRHDDSIGLGGAFSWLNNNRYSRPTELMLQLYYQAKIINEIYLEPALSYIPTPGESPLLNPAWAGTLRAVILF